ncbi:N-acetylmuramoyl-L-alanine amidase [Loigolactobacillus coryniformis]|uniref:N-acetylmuramoyl-L-alanine amidase n=1 Tax=Loigolactobacillus coryniformis TaxID=1610 RepID=UPI0023412ECE|nr:N-acetylmuramoyl-L-alanine amidase [Loigolactobacillus coryniformis]MDC4184571.1 N-acetylmuramoyl-L-alanine amidase [Loigolactobacillus coryniformis]
MMVTINKQFAFGANEGSSQKTQSLYIILHEVGVDNSSARANAAYFKNNWSTAETYSTFVVGADGIYQVGEPGYVAWAALNANPYAPVQIEFERTNDANRFKKGYANYIALAREMADKYGIPKTLDAGGAGTPGIKSHLWVTNNYGGDHVDPYGYLASHGISKSQLAKDLANGVTSPATIAPVASNAKTVGTDVTYALRSLNGGWLDNVTNFGDGDNGYAGVPNQQHDYLTVSVNHGSIKYRVKTAQDGWLGWVTGSNRNDLVNGAAGVTGHAITGVQIVYNTPSSENYQQAYYRSQTTQRSGWLGVCADDGSVIGFDSWAGIDGEPLDRLQIKIAPANPF